MKPGLVSLNLAGNQFTSKGLQKMTEALLASSDRMTADQEMLQKVPTQPSEQGHIRIRIWIIPRKRCSKKNSIPTPKLSTNLSLSLSLSKVSIQQQQQRLKSMMMGSGMGWTAMGRMGQDRYGSELIPG